MEYVILNREIYMQVNGKIIKWRGVDHTYFRAVMFTLEKFKMEENMEMESIFTTMVTHMMVCGNKIKNKALAHLLTNKKVKNMKENGLKELKKVKEYIDGKMVINMKEVFCVD